MSIILEALKKANKKAVDFKPEVQMLKTDDLHLRRSVLIVVAMILCAGFLFSFIFKERDYPREKALRLKIDTPSPKSTAATNLKVEGYTPPQPVPKQEPAPVTIFNLKPSNPRLRLSGIIYGLGNPTAIIENKIVEEGESIKGAKVLKIYADYVELLNESSGEIFVLKVR
ncbi:MAG: hypothetical protein AMJ78_09255 [Omnitrophica WOR_2 bacterium SM23_29]|nr:MAG: hypothetical protein AMJ78_09255 [Omnitrophica WOR_2 bacterium SM23_29]